jgi:ABC-type glycerol-3-phosphate transport system permease component
MKALRADAVKHVIVWTILVLTYYPLLFSAETSLKSNTQFQYNVFGPTWPIYLSNYGAAWSGIAGFIWNTVVIAVVTVAFTLVFGSMAAFVFARYDFPGKRIVFYLFLALLMIPSILTLIPLFLEVKGMGLLNNWLALILPYIAGGQAITVFILQAFFSSLPEEMFEAARIDGASEFQAFVRIAIPLSSAILGAMAIISALGVWGDYLWPTIVLQDSHLYTISAGIANYVSSFGLVAQVGPTFASYVLASLPVVILIILTMKYYVTGLTTGALKL